MKKILILALAVCAFYSCGNSNSKQTKEEEVKANVDEFANIAENVNKDNGHNAKNSLDYEGGYKGTLPTASGEGMVVILRLSETTFSKTVSYVGKEDSKSMESGKYSWNEAGNTITLEGVTAPNQYFVGENTLRQLDINGNKIEGDLSEKYILEKYE